MVVSQDESEEIVDEHDAEDDLDNDADDLDDVDVGEDEAEHLGTEDLDIQTKEKEITQVQGLLSFTLAALILKMKLHM